MKKLQLLLTLSILSTKLIFAQSSQTVRTYIATYKDIAIEEMQRTGVPAAITLAQGIHETEAGTSDLVRASNNHFGIKCKSDWTGQTVYHDDDAKGECFRKYDDPRDSYKDHSDFLKNRPNYAFLFRLDPTDFEGWAYGLKKAGYATNPKYPQILIKLIRDYNLEDYTLIAMGRKAPASDEGTWTNTAAVNTIKSESSSDAKDVEPELVVEKVSYPTGPFRINEADVMYVTKGTSFLKVAQEGHVSLSRMFEFNEMDPADIALKDQLVFLQRKRKTGATELHTVAAGETVYDIAQKEGIRLESLMGYNHLKDGMQPQVGEKLYLTSKAPSMPRLVSEQEFQKSAGSIAFAQPPNDLNSQNGFILHTVQPKETMYSIAKKYSVNVEDLMKWNDLQSIDLKTGQQLRIIKKTVNATN